MMYKILQCCAVFFTFFSLEAQRVNGVFAITGDNKDNNPFLWTNISEVDLKSGQVVQPLYTHLKTAFDLYDGLTNIKRYGSSMESNKIAGTPQMPTSFVVAAAAYDGRHNRIFTIPLQQPEIRWIDLDDNKATLKIYTVPLPINAADLLNESGPITRMVIAADGYGYALSNDANHLIRFSTGRKIVITDLGALQDATGNGAISVHNKCSSFGGDMISDAAGNLYLFSAYHAIFKIDVTGKTATYIGNIKNLPADYTTNGAAVNEDGDLIVSSALSTGGYFRVDMNTWEAVKLTCDNKTLPVSDLASRYFAFQKKQPAISTTVFNNSDPGVSNISVYPNPVTEAAFHISFDNKEIGRYMVQLLDVSGRTALQQPVNLVYKSQAIEIEMPAGFSKGIYLVKVVSTGGKTMYANKILVN